MKGGPAKNKKGLVCWLKLKLCNTIATPPARSILALKDGSDIL